jgi:hypothetical protein
MPLPVDPDRRLRISEAKFDSSWGRKGRRIVMGGEVLLGIIIGGVIFVIVLIAWLTVVVGSHGGDVPTTTVSDPTKSKDGPGT